MIIIKAASVADIVTIQEIAYKTWPHTYEGILTQAQLDYMLDAFYAYDVLMEATEMGLNRERMSRWAPLNQGLYLTSRTLLSGMLLSSKGDRACMNASVEMRHPFLDEDLFDFCAKLHPRWKLRGLQDKFLLRTVAKKWLPKRMARRRKAMFLTPWESLCPRGDQAPTYVEELLSEASLRRAGYFDAANVAKWRVDAHQLRRGSLLRTSIEMCLVGVVSTQLWHHSFIDGTLANLPSHAGQTPCREPGKLELRTISTEPVTASPVG